jgi:hypothetical protein
MWIKHEELLEALGPASTPKVVNRFRGLAYVHASNLEKLANAALSEEWGQNSYVLEKYLAVQVAWAIEQRAYTFSRNQLYVSAGHLQTRYGTPLYLVFERNDQVDMQPLKCVTVGSDISAPSLPIPPDIPEVPEINPASEIVMLHDHILRDNADRVPFLKGTPPVAQMCAISGAIQWSLNRGLHLPYYYYGNMSFLAPLYLQSRENITQSPDLIAPVQVNPRSLVVRTVLLPHMPYANARVAVERHDQLLLWMLDTWNNNASTVSEDQIDNPESSHGSNGDNQ